MTESTQPPQFALEGAITIDTAGPVNTSGAFCDLFTGIHPIAGKVALKRPRGASYTDALMRQIEIEAGVWVKLNHPRILKFLGLYTFDAVIYLVSPFAEFGSLPSYLKSFPSADRGRLVIEIAEGLAYLHQFEPGIVHGDVKGNSVLIASDHHARLCDFGLARHVDARTATALKGAGSLPWQSPEILRDGVSKSLQSDVGKEPYSDYPSIGAIIAGVLFSGLRPPLEPPAAPDGTSYLRFWNEATRCWSDNPAERPSMADVLQSLSNPTDEPKTVPLQLSTQNQSQNIASISLRTGLAGGSRAQIPTGANVAATPKRKAEDVDDSILRAPKRHRLLLDQSTASTSQDLEAVPELHIPSSSTPEASFEPESLSLDEPPEIDDRPIQHETDNKLLLSVEYSEEIYQYLKDLETTRMPPHRYLDTKPEQTWRTRGTVVDWLQLVHKNFRLRPDTFWMTINLFDRFISLREVDVMKFQLAALVCSSLASKYLEITPPALRAWVHSADGAYDANAILAGELIAASDDDNSLVDTPPQ
ncbi:hypothetical protein FRC05_009470 [Tulasnella sp. 425]|nr:hypothetical protein FRC05_009470 [Tulasnella sp. 425]